jgi:predicted PurR-regulated permease PerM
MTTTHLDRTIRILLLLCWFLASCTYWCCRFYPAYFWCRAGYAAVAGLPLAAAPRAMSNGFASVLSLIALLLMVSGLILLLEIQLSDIAQDLSKIQQRVNGLIAHLKDYVQHTFGISRSEQQKMIKEQQGDGMGKAAGMITALVGSFASILIDAVLVLVYTFLFIYFRAHFKSFILRILSRQNRETAKDVLQNASTVTQHYLGGLGLMIVMLWVMYGIGFSIAGVQNALFFAILCGILELVPFAGNITGTSITVLMALAQSGDTRIVIGVIITYGCVQLLQTYILEPLVVGERLNINPLFTILIIVVGEALWGIAGMILAVPLLGIFKIVCDNSEPLKDIGYLIGPPREKKGEGGNFITRLFRASK